MSEEAIPSLPNPPFYTIANVNNFRDAAYSLKTSSGARIRPNMLFRSAEVSKLDLAGWKAVHEIGVGHVFDLRSKPEVDKGWAGIVGKDANAAEDDVRPGWIQAMDAAGVKRTWTPVFEESDYSPERLAERYSKYMGEAVTGFVEAYRDILQNGGPAFGQILRYLATLPPQEEEEKSKASSLGALVHCTAGKDRTGIFFGLLFDFLGVPRDDIATEYQLTELGLHHVRDTVVARLLQSPAFRKYAAEEMAGKKMSREEVARILEAGEGGVQPEMEPQVMERGRQAALRMVGAKKESMLRSLDMLDDVFGGAERYLRERCGMSDTELEALRTNLVVEA
ncbi:hypothetical protein yc1106_02313 [Curvularia clavata]|uniref:Tyrosine specific protein phosphatases domain-containing protein n=1 Tax=Curvularia clavata TaxID=95742 RepID=A0A9Q9DQT8_CURCL|nr:hypothetical protein yc1106_02313 [Curvularia clavata]